jgi:CheY-like chemotaxis protein
MTSKKKIMVVDDQFVSRLLVKEILKDDYETVSYEDARKALLHLEKQQPDMVITDLMMPEMSGLEFAEAIKLRFPQLPILAVSAWSDYTNKKGAEQLEDFLAKPYTIGSLKRKVHQIMNP